jgi:subtilase family serine protease
LVGELPGATQLHLAIGLPLRNPADLDALLNELYDPASQQYRHFVTPSQFAERFGPTDTDYQALAAFARDHGLAVESMANRGVLSVTGTAASVETAFHVTLLTRRRPDGSVFYAPDREPSLDLDVPVSHISGLDNFIPPKRHLVAAPTPVHTAKRRRASHQWFRTRWHVCRSGLPECLCSRGRPDW